MQRSIVTREIAPALRKGVRLQPTPSDEAVREAVVKTRKTVGAKIRKLRKEHDWTQEDLAKACGLSAARLGRAERGQADLTFETRIVIAKKFKPTVEELLKDNA